MIIYTSDIRKKAQNCFKKGMGYKATAHKLQLPVSAVREWNRLWKAGQFRENPGQPNDQRHKYTDADIRKMVHYHGRGFTYTRIGEMFGCSAQYASRRINQFIMKLVRQAAGNIGAAR